jgi:KaiC/GvpD/RAD55 family RecA-like ATPase
MVNLNRRCPSGIVGLDELIEGGFPRQRSILLSGTCGSGKTTFAVQFLYKGITEYNEPGILISLEQDPRELKEDMAAFGFDLQKEEDQGKLIIIDASLARAGTSRMDSSITSSRMFSEQLAGSRSLMPDEFNIDRILDLVVEDAGRIGAKRVALDSLPALEFLMGNQNETEMRHSIRQLLISINYRLKNAGLTTMLITEIPEEGPRISSAHGVESYVADGAINMYYTTMGMESGRNMIIRKMRGTAHSEDVHPLAFKRGVGIQVMKPADTFQELEKRPF